MSARDDLTEELAYLADKWIYPGQPAYADELKEDLEHLLKRTIREAKADGWDEGVEARETTHPMYLVTNPYRADEMEGR